MARTYSEKLQDDRWKMKRYRILEARGRKCQTCGTKDGTIQVHHGFYYGGLEPWEYPDEALHVLCKPCHTHAHKLMDQLKPELAMLHPEALDEVLRFCKSLRRALSLSWEDMKPELSAIMSARRQHGMGIMVDIGEAVGDYTEGMM